MATTPATNILFLSIYYFFDIYAIFISLHFLIFDAIVFFFFFYLFSLMMPAAYADLHYFLIDDMPRRDAIS